MDGIMYTRGRAGSAILKVEPPLTPWFRRYAVCPLDHCARCGGATLQMRRALGCLTRQAAAICSRARCFRNECGLRYARK